MKQNPIINIIVAGYRDKLAFLFSCPMKGSADLEKLRVFDKILNFFPTKTFRYKEMATFASADGKQDVLSVAIVFEIYDDGK